MEDESEKKGKEERISKLEGKINTLKDKTLMEELEDIAIESELKEIETLLGYTDINELKEKLELIDQIEEEYKQGEIHKKLNYLYNEIEEIKEDLKDLKEEKRKGKKDYVRKNRFLDTEDTLKDAIRKVNNKIENYIKRNEKQNYKEKTEELEKKIKRLNDKYNELENKVETSSAEENKPN